MSATPIADAHLKGPIRGDGYRDRVGQRIGPIEVLADHGRTKRGKVIWRCFNSATGQEMFLKTYELSRLAKLHNVPAPPLADRWSA